MKTVHILSPALLAAFCLPAFAQGQGESADRPVVPPAAAERPEYAVEPRRDIPTPIGSEYGWVTNADYPLDAWRNGEEGFVDYELDVDQAGKVTDCRIAHSSGFPALDAQTCRLLIERARFDPAQDSRRKPIAGVFYGSIIWQRREAEFGSGSFTIKLAFTIDERGKASNCRIIERTGAVPADMQRRFESNPCPSGQEGAPVRDAEGRPVAHDVVMTIGLESAPSAYAGAAQPGN